MPTGYTTKLHDGGQSFYDFAMTCSSAFGARILERDNAPGPDWKPREIGDYHHKALMRCNESLIECELWPDSYWERKARSEFNQSMAKWDEDELKRGQRESRYRAMLDRVKDWNPPTHEHIKFKEFMVEQLQSSIDFDCSSNEAWKPKQKTAEQFKRDTIASLRKDVDYHTREIEAEAKRVEGSNKWMINLINSLPKDTNE